MKKLPLSILYVLAGGYIFLIPVLRLAHYASGNDSQSINDWFSAWFFLSLIVIGPTLVSVGVRRTFDVLSGISIAIAILVVLTLYSSPLYGILLSIIGTAVVDILLIVRWLMGRSRPA